MNAFKQRSVDMNAWFVKQTSRYLNFFVVANIASLYIYLLWDSFAGDIPALSGGPGDPLFGRGDRFMDWVNTLKSAGLIQPYGLQGQIAMPVYGPLTYMALKPIVIILAFSPAFILLAKLLWLAITAIVIVSFVHNIQRIRRSFHGGSKAISPFLLTSVILLGYPFLFAFDRGNLEMITFGLVAWYLACVFDHKKKRPSESLFCLKKSDLILALAICIKPYTILFALCNIIPIKTGSKAQRKQTLLAFIRSLSIAILISVTSLALLYNGDIVTGYRELKYWQQAFRSGYVIGNTGDLFFCSPFIAIKMILSRLAAPEWAMNLFFQIYPLLALLVAIAVFVIIFRLNSHRTWGKNGATVLLSAIVFTLLIFPYNANEYKAIYALLPFILAYSPQVDKDDSAILSMPITSPRSMTPQSVSIFLCFVLLVNRYSFLGSKTGASMFATLILVLFPILLLFSTDARSRITKNVVP